MINSKIVVCYQANIENQGSYESAESSEYSKEQKELQNLNMRFESFDADGLNLLE
jgi:hypothetical protein